MPQKSLAINKRARFDYEVLESLEAGLELLGTEVKSVKSGNISLKGAFVTIHDEQAWLTNAVIPPWQIANAPATYDPSRPRRLLIKKSELKSLIGSKSSQGLTIIPLRVYTKRGRIKLAVGLARGKRKYEKKQQKKEKDLDRETQRLLAGRDL
ncbi:MAG: SsrA-binding protein SmpB [Candidatus Andersenbacteria bacterium]|nr:SsrA-binding protein SmpB [Candidatus Andersenbacteria bacterium]MBI3250980.1 SsrA-binding protein SmpB [Candidatus Andersenbacteria bacterium]